ncbi:MAG: hypothetical protein WBW55_01285 [Desulfobaccales bacterium]
MIEIIDFGCNEHNWRQVTFTEPDADFVKACIYNLPKDGKYHTYICAHGYTHRIREIKMPYVALAPAYEKISNPSIP